MISGLRVIITVVHILKQPKLADMANPGDGIMIAVDHRGIGVFFY